MEPSKSVGTLKIVHLDDDAFVLERVENLLKSDFGFCRFAVESINNISQYRQKLETTKNIDIVLLDIHIADPQHPKISGITLAKETREKYPNTVIIMRSTMDDVSTITDCLNVGADDFISKQSEKEELSLRIFNSYRLAKMKRGVTLPQGGITSEIKIRNKLKFCGATLNKIANRVPNIMDSAIIAVHVFGESGTGKEVVADLFASHIKDTAPFIKINCGAIAPGVLESELFGHVKGAFTGAQTDKTGLMESASGGWVFLDEVATLTMSAQTALLRTIENQEIRRVGSSMPRPIKVRVLSASNESLPRLVTEGKFRKDLWQRLREAEIYLPPLRERPEEIRDIIKHFCEIMPGGPYKITSPALDVLCSALWKSGNIRELRNCLRAMTELHINRLLTPLSIPERIWEELDADISNEKNGGCTEHDEEIKLSSGTRKITIDLGDSLPVSFDILSDQLLLEVTRKLAKEQGKFSLRGLAKMIGLSRSTLSGRLKNLIHKNLIEAPELVKLVSISEKSD